MATTDPPKKRSLDDLYNQGTMVAPGQQAAKTRSLDDLYSQLDDEGLPGKSSAPSVDMASPSPSEGGNGVGMSQPGPPTSPDRKKTIQTYWNADAQARAFNQQYREAQEKVDVMAGLPGQVAAQQREIGRIADLQARYADVAGRTKALFDREIDAAVKEVTAKAPLTMEREGVEYADPASVMAAAKHIALSSGQQDPEFEKLVYDRLLAHVDTGIIEKDATRIFEEKAKPLLEEHSAKMGEAFKTDDIEIAKAEGFLQASVAALNEAAKTDVNAIASVSQEQAAQVNAGVEQAGKQYESQAAAIQQAVASGQLDQVQGQAQLDALYKQVQQKEAEASAAIGEINQRSMREVGAVNQRYNRRFQDEQRRVLEGAQKRVAEAAKKFNAEYGSSPEGMAIRDRLKKLQKDSWDEASAARGKKMSDVASARFNNAQGMFGSILSATTSRFVESTISGLGGSIKGIASTAGSESFFLLGEEMERAFVLPEAKSDSFSDLLDAQNFAQVSGQLAGGMIPSIGASVAAAAATGGASIPIQMLATGAAGWGAETLDITGRNRDEVFRKTGSREKADKAAWDSFVGQVQLVPAYAFEGLPFVGKALDFIGSRSLRVGAAAGIEYGTELFQEIPQSIAEKNILEGREPYEDFFSGLGEMSDTGELKSLLVTMAPIAVLGGAGQVTAKSRKEAAEDKAKAYMAKTEVAKYVEGASGQWVNDMIDAGGRDFSTAVISSLFTGGHINSEAKVTELMKVQEQVLNARDEASRIGLGQKDRSVYTALSLQMNALREQAETATSAPAKAVAERRAKEIERSLTDFANEGRRQYVEIGFSDDKSLIMDRQAAWRVLKDPAFILQAAMQGDALSIDFQGDGMEQVAADFQGAVMNVSDVIEAMKAQQAAEEDGVVNEEESKKEGSAFATARRIRQRIANDIPLDERKKEFSRLKEELMKEAEKPPQIPISDDVDADTRDRMLRAREETGIRYDPLNDLTEKVSKAFDNIEKGSTVDPVSLDETSDWFNKKLKEVVAMRGDPERPLTTEQIDSYEEFLKESIATIEKYKIKLKEDAARDSDTTKAKPKGKAAPSPVAKEPRQTKKPKTKRRKQPRVKVNGQPGPLTVEQDDAPEKGARKEPSKGRKKAPVAKQVPAPSETGKAPAPKPAPVNKEPKTEKKKDEPVKPVPNKGTPAPTTKTPTAKAAPSVQVVKPAPVKPATPVEPEEAVGKARRVSEQEAKTLAAKLTAAFGIEISIDKESWEKNVPEKGRGAKGVVLKDGKVYLNPDKVTIDTPLHEVAGHILLNSLKNGNEKDKALYKKIIDLTKQAPKNLLDKIIATYPELDPKSDKFWEEVFSTFIGLHQLNIGKAEEVLVEARKDLTYWSRVLSVFRELLMRVLGTEKVSAWDARTLGELVSKIGEAAYSGKRIVSPWTRAEVIAESRELIEPHKNRYTLQALKSKGFQSMKGKKVKKQQIEDALKQSGIKEIEKDIIGDVLKFPRFNAGPIDFDDFAFHVGLRVTPLMRIESDAEGSFADYGMRDIGASKETHGAPLTIIFNSPTVNHGIVGHFRGFFGQAIEWELKPLGASGEWVAIDKNMPTGLALDQMVNYVGYHGTKEKTQKWIEDYTPGDGKMNVGLFGHIRRFFKGPGHDYYLAEVQGDTFQKENMLVALLPDKPKAKAEIAITILKNKAVEQIETEWFTGSERGKATRELAEHLDKAYEMGLPKNASSSEKMAFETAHPDWSLKYHELVDAATANSRSMEADVGVDDKGLLRYRQMDEAGYFGAPTEIDGRWFLKDPDSDKLYGGLEGYDSESEAQQARQDLLNLDVGHFIFRGAQGAPKKLEEVIKKAREEYQARYKEQVQPILDEEIPKLPPEGRQMAASLKTWEQRLMREAIQDAFRQGASSVRFPTMNTLAGIEKYKDVHRRMHTLPEPVAQAPRAPVGDMPYTVVSADDEERLEIGDLIDMGGTEYRVVQADDDTITVIEDSDVRHYEHYEAVDHYMDSWYDGNGSDIRYELRAYGRGPFTPDILQEALGRNYSWLADALTEGMEERPERDYEPGVTETSDDETFVVVDDEKAPFAASTTGQYVGLLGGAAEVDEWIAKAKEDDPDEEWIRVPYRPGAPDLFNEEGGLHVALNKAFYEDAGWSTPFEDAPKEFLKSFKFIGSKDGATDMVDDLEADWESELEDWADENSISMDDIMEKAEEVDREGAEQMSVEDLMGYDDTWPDGDTGAWVSWNGSTEDLAQPRVYAEAETRRLAEEAERVALQAVEEEQARLLPQTTEEVTEDAGEAVVVEEKPVDPGHVNIAAAKVPAHRTVLAKHAERMNWFKKERPNSVLVNDPSGNSWWSSPKMEGDEDNEVIGFSRELPEDDEMIEVDGKQRPAVNSTGRRIHPTDDGIRNFWKWFGDSKVVDEQGRPLVVYHGTDKQVDVFMQSGTGELGRGMYFTKDKKEALDYAYGRRGDSEVVHEVYLKMDNPITVKNASNDLWDKYSKKGESDDVMTRAIQAKGHDGIVLTTPEVKYDNFKRKYQKTGKTREHIVVWQPSQIKSATGNTGAFSPSDDDIRFSKDLSGTSPRKMANDFKRIGYDAARAKEYMEKRGMDADTIEIVLGLMPNEPAPPPAPKPKPASTEPQEPRTVKKTIATKRAYEGGFRSEVKDAIEELGLYRDVESHEESRQAADTLIESVGIDGALYAARNNDVKGARAAYIYLRAIEDVDRQMSEKESDSDPEEWQQLVDEKAELIQEFDVEAVEAGRFGSALGDIYETSDLGWRSEVVERKWEREFGEAPPKDLVTKWKERDKEFEELRKQVAEAQKRSKKAAESALIAAIKGAAKKERANDTPKKRKTVADRIRSLKIGQSGVMQASLIPPAVWNAAVEIAALAYEAGEGIAAAAARGVRKLRQSQRYGELTEEQQKQAEADFRKQITGKESDDMVSGKIRVPKRMIREAVEAGANDIDSLVAIIKENLKDDYPGATDREIRDAITGYGRIITMSKDEIDVEIRRLNRIGRLVSNIEDVQAKKRPLRSGLQRDKITEEEKVLLKELKELMRDLPIDLEADERKMRTTLETAKTATKTRIEDLQRRIAEGDFSKPTKRELAPDDELTRLRADRLRLQEEYDKEFYKNKLKNRDLSEKVGDTLWEAWGFVRALNATFDLSFMLVQGGPQFISNLWHNPQAIRAATKNMVEAMRSEKRSEDLLRSAKVQDWYPAIKKAGLALTEPHAELSAREELFVSDWTKFIWDYILGAPARIAGPAAHAKWSAANPFRALERGASAFLDTFRLFRALEGVEVLDNKKAAGEQITDKDYKDVADVINTMTGRASLGIAEPMAKGLTKALYSPRLWASRIKMATPYAFWYLYKKNPTARKMALLDMSRYIATTLGMVMMAAIYLNGDDDDETGVEFDPRSSDFLKVKLGKTRVDPWAGHLQQVIFTARLALGVFQQDAYKNKKGEVMPLGIPYKSPTMSDVIGQMATNKLSPSAALIWDYFSTTRDMKGNLRTRFGKEYHFDEALAERTTPIFFQTLTELAKDDPGAITPFLMLYTFVGGGVNVYEDKKDTGKKPQKPARP